MGAPFLILTGFLGAGKTTILNRLLAAEVGRRIAVLVNELGRIHIDRQLITGQDGDILELSGGCVCCKVDLQRDLWTGVVDVVRRSRPEHVVLETTGIAEPAALLDMPAWVAEEISLSGVITVVDAQEAPRQVARHHEARAQIECADRLLVSKLDVATAEQALATHRLLDELAPDADRAGFPRTVEATHSMVRWLLEPRPRRGRPEARAHRHGQLVSASFVDDTALHAAPLEATLARLGDALVRAKGFVHIAGDPRRWFLERAGAATTLAPADPWGDRPPRTELVLIGDGLDEAALRRTLWACRAG